MVQDLESSTIEKVFGCTGATITLNLILNNVSQGKGTGETASGGGIFIGSEEVEVTHNTIVANRAFGEVESSGGGLAIGGGGIASRIESNIFAFNVGYGLTCRANSGMRFGRNIVWSNYPANADSVYCNAGVTANLIHVNPKFCGEEAGDYSVSTSSPAINDGNLMGAFSVPGCADVIVVPATWSAIKVRFK